MGQPVAPQLDRAKVRILHLALVAGVVGIGAVVSFLLWNGTAPILAGEQLDLITYSIAVPSLASILVGWFCAKPRIPRRRRSQSTDDFWRTPHAAGNALVLWVLTEGAALMGLITILMTGSATTAIVAALGLVVLLTNGPGHLEGRLE